MIKQFDHDFFNITAHITDYNKVLFLSDGDVRSVGLVDVFIELGGTVLLKRSMPFDVDIDDAEQVFGAIKRSYLPALIKEATSML
jgi:hypothetical protein